MRELNATDRFPVRQHEVEIRITIDVVVVTRAYGSGQVSLGIKQDGECRWAVGVGNCRQRLLAEPLRSRGADFPRLAHGLDQQPGRGAFELALVRGNADARHRLAALLVGHVTESRQHRFAIFDLHRRVRVFLIAVPSRTRPVIRKIPRHGECSISQEARL